MCMHVYPPYFRQATEKMSESLPYLEFRNSKPGVFYLEHLTMKKESFIKDIQFKLSATLKNQ